MKSVSYFGNSFKKIVFLGTVIEIRHGGCIYCDGDKGNLSIKQFQYFKGLYPLPPHSPIKNLMIIYIPVMTKNLNMRRKILTFKKSYLFHISKRA